MSKILHSAAFSIVRDQGFMDSSEDQIGNFVHPRLDLGSYPQGGGAYFGPDPEIGIRDTELRQQLDGVRHLLCFLVQVVGRWLQS